MRFSSVVTHIVLVIFTLTFAAVNVTAVAPTEEAVKKWKAEGVWEQVVANWKAFKKTGGCAPEEHPVFNPQKRRENLALGVQAVQTVRVIVILVDFSDNPYTNGTAGTPAMFDSILFSDRDSTSAFNPTGSMTEYYLENSYGQFYIKGDIFGWYRMDSTYEWYEGGNDGLTRGAILAGDAVDAAESAGVDFSKYDANLDGYCDGVVVIHAGRGAEEGVFGIWSHKSNIYMYKDGVLITSYTMNPEESGNNLSPIGVFCHEYGHLLGLPDLYDTGNNQLAGLGKWSLMASGNYLGNSQKPAHLDAWCKARVGFLDFVVPDSNVYQAEIPEIEHNPVAYKLKNSYSDGQYWVVENRQRVGFDQYLPGAGLCIYHVDTLAPLNNSYSTRYYVALEQADGHNDLALPQGNRGDAGDPWPGATNAREFHNLTNPDTKTNEVYMVSPPAETKIAVWRISNSDTVMYADFDITEYSRPWVELYGNNALVFDDSQGGDGDGVLEAGESIQFFCTIKNLMRGSYNIHASLATNNPSVDFVINDVAFGADLFGVPRSNVNDSVNAPIVFTISDTLTSTIDSFYLTITTDSLDSTPGSGEFNTTFGFEVQLGGAQVLIVDDDRGANFETVFEDVFYNLRIPTKTWHKQTQGSPTGADLQGYNIVFWHTGDSTSGVLDSNDTAAMKDFMDNGGKLLLTTVSGVIDLHQLDTAFLANYFHAQYTDTGWWFDFNGVTGNIVGDGTKYRNVVNPLRTLQLLTPVTGGEAAFVFSNDPSKVCGVTYTGAYKSILLTFPVEFIDNYIMSYDHIDTLLARVLKFFGGIKTSVYDGHSFGQLPQNFELYQNYPNPFNPSTNISYTLRATGGFGKKPARTNLSIYNILGQRVKTLVDEVQIPGAYVVSWDGTNRFGRAVASGVYFYRLERGDSSEAKKMILLK